MINIPNPKKHETNQKKPTKEAPAAKQRPLLFSHDKEKNREQEQTPEQYAVDTLSDQGKQGVQTVKKTVQKLTEQKEEPPVPQTAPEYYRTPAVQFHETGKTLKLRESPEQIHHMAAHKIKTMDSGVRDKSTAVKQPPIQSPSTPALNVYIRQKEAERFQQRILKYRDAYTGHLPASDITGVGFSMPQTASADQARQTAAQKFTIKQRIQRKKKKQGAGNPSSGNGDSTSLFRNMKPSGHPANQSGQRRDTYSNTGYSEPSVFVKYEKPPQNVSSPTEPEPNSKKLKVADRRSGTLKTKDKTDLKRYSSGFKSGTKKGLKSTGNPEKSALQGVKASRAVTGQAGSTAGTNATVGAASGGVMAAIQIVKKGKEKLQEIAEKNTAKANATEGNAQTLGCFGVVVCVLFIPFFLIFFLLFGNNSFSSGSNKNLSAEVLAYMPLIQEACQRHEISEYANLVAAIMMQESGGRTEAVNGDVMQAAESQGWPAGTPIEPALSIDYGVQHFKKCLELAGMPPPSDISGISLALQSYNFGTGYASWALSNYGGYTKENAIAFSNIWAAKMGWSSYGDVHYVDHVLRYYEPGGEYGGVGDVGLIGDGLIAYPMPGYTWETYERHSGIDVNTGGVNGKPIMAAANGIVSYAKNGWQPSDGTNGINSYGNVVYIEHEGTPYQTRYAHMSYCTVSAGEYVQQGQIIGYVGSTGNSSGPHLHFEIVVNGNRWHPDGRNYAEIAFPQYVR